MRFRRTAPDRTAFIDRGHADGRGTLLMEAEKAKSVGDFRKAATLYERFLAQEPQNANIHVQCGNMLKDAMQHEAAERHYLEAKKTLAQDPDLALQLGHLYKMMGRLGASMRAYERACALDPMMDGPQTELANYAKLGLSVGTERSSSQRLSIKMPGQPRGGWDGQLGHVEEVAGFRRSIAALAPELSPRHVDDVKEQRQRHIVLRRFGRSERTLWGNRNTLRGVEAIRGFYISASPVVEVYLRISDTTLYRAGPLQGFPLKDSLGDRAHLKYVFNLWFDFSLFSPGRYDIDIVLRREDGEEVAHREWAVIGDPVSVEEHADSDAIIAPQPFDPASVESRVDSAPSMIRSARRDLLPSYPKSIAVVRLDQLGDMVTSIPGLRRLREVFPDARIVGLIAPGNLKFVTSLALFDEVITVDFPDDPVEERRVMPFHQQRDLRKRLETYRFDLAIDMSHSGVSRPILLLTGAKFLYGFGPGEFPWLSAAFDGVTRDFANGLECVPHTQKLVGLVEWLRIITRNHATVVRRLDLPRSSLAAFGLSEDDRFVVLHTGARLAFSRWPHYLELTFKLIEETDLKVVMFSDDVTFRHSIPAHLLASDHFILIDKKIDFDEFDALVSHCEAFVGNDSGPKHLASLRGANVVSVHLARNNWNEWGQELGGYIVSRRVPCAGCVVHHDPEECGKEFTCIKHIKVDEVFTALRRAMDEGRTGQS